MPVKKNGDAGTEIPTKENRSEVGSPTGLGVGARRLLWTLIGILLVYSIVFIATLIRNNLKKYEVIGQAERMERTIAVEASGKVTATPNIAVASMGMQAEGKTVAEAQQKNTAVMNNLITKLQTLGVAKADIQTTNYSIYPKYDYKDEKQEVRGYEVSQNVVVKIRDLTKANQVIALAGEVGANNVSGLQFTIDDRDAYREQARQLALQKVRAKTIALSKALGVRVRGIVSYNEFEGGPGGPSPYAEYAVGRGGDGASTPPTIEPGSTDVVMHVTVVFEIR